MKRLAVRHAESNGKASGGGDSVENADALSPGGLTQAKALAVSLDSWEIENTSGGTEETILMASHGYFIRKRLNRMLKRPIPEAFHHDNGGMTRMNFKTAWEMEFCNRQIDGAEAVQSTTRQHRSEL